MLKKRYVSGEGSTMDEQHDCHVEPLEKPVDHEALSGAMAAQLAVWGMGCPRCAMRVRNSLLALDGVLIAEVHLNLCVAAVVYDPLRVTCDDLLRAVSAAGNDGRHHYEAELIRRLHAIHALG